MFNFNIKEVEIAELLQLLEKEKQDVHRIDVRSPMEIAQGAIEGADHMPLHTLPMSLDRIPEDKKVIFYCRTGARSAQACAFLSQQGVENVYNLRGGIMAWAQSGLAVA